MGINYPKAEKLVFPLLKYAPITLNFKDNVSNWGIHLGEDISTPAGAKVKCVGAGEVVYSACHLGNIKKRNWGNIMIIGHQDSQKSRIFYSLYGHLGERFIKKGSKVKKGQAIGTIGAPNTPENGYWPAHLHFGIYLGPWEGIVLPGYFRPERTRIEHWENPSIFINNYNFEHKTISKKKRKFPL